MPAAPAPDALAVAALGFLLGLRHAADADHVVAVTAIVARERSFARAARVGALWGLGHSAALLAAGGAIVAFRIAVPPRLGLGLEFAVALVLVALGVENVRRGAAGRGAPDPARAAADGATTDDATVRPLVVGTLHGLAGSAAAALLVLATVRDPRWAAAYLAVFGLGTVAGMVGVTACVALPARLAGARVARLQHRLRLAAGALSLVFGLGLAHEAVVTRGLFGPAPAWDPR